MKMKKLLASLSVLSLLSLSPLHAGRLGDLIESHGLGWMMGAWTAGGDAGEISLNYTLELDGNVVSVHFKAGDVESKGMMGLRPGSDKVFYGFMDNRGSAGMGSWEEIDGHPALLLKTTSADGEERSMVLVHRKVADDTLAVDYHSVDESGAPSSSPEWTIEFKRKP